MIEKLNKEFGDDEYVNYAESPTTGRDSVQFVPPLEKIETIDALKQPLKSL